ncbi:MAG: SUMF1/EgtB/PvdO family nonheme iron enzyme [Deltaproteobacteria bacterium]|nr:SUMF1/EgtB/PvdO family nonheme iron enzyme [Deltaproteobacteria bacterium]
METSSCSVCMGSTRDVHRVSLDLVGAVERRSPVLGGPPRHARWSASGPSHAEGEPRTVVLERCLFAKPARTKQRLDAGHGVLVAGLGVDPLALGKRDRQVEGLNPNALCHLALEVQLDRRGSFVPQRDVREGFEPKIRIELPVDAGEHVPIELGREPLTHVSFYEAEAIARFMGARLPTEAEWEVAAAQSDATSGNFVETGLLRAAAPPAPSTSGTVLQLFGDAWEWTGSAYGPYPGFTPHAGTIGEYNGKFMVNQLALRGGSCFTPRGHVRPSYRNFWPPDTRFQVTGLRLARGVKA